MKFYSSVLFLFGAVWLYYFPFFFFKEYIQKGTIAGLIFSRYFLITGSNQIMLNGRMAASGKPKFEHHFVGMGNLLCNFGDATWYDYDSRYIYKSFSISQKNVYLLFFQFFKHEFLGASRSYFFPPFLSLTLWNFLIFYINYVHKIYLSLSPFRIPELIKYNSL